MPDSQPSTPDTPYRLREHFLSAPEIALFRLLQKMTGDRYIVCPKVALTDIFTIVRPNENVHFYNKIFRKHVDFMLCDPQTFKPVFGVELIKPTGRHETRPNDQFMEELFQQEGVPLVHIPLSEHYEMADLAHLFQLAVTKTAEMTRTEDSTRQDSSPLCPVCGKMMTLRIHRDGPHAGRKYYGCMDSPRCPGTLPIN